MAWTHSVRTVYSMEISYPGRNSIAADGNDFRALLLEQTCRQYLLRSSMIVCWQLIRRDESEIRHN
ncbi:hypothetical protein DV706_09155 [Natronorubrum bangense]|uniref:Uncharacterized protein n=2 Tax=Natronorubrum bangense TaxID=61858 RepID=L9WPJ8_9EURY|nr:hypothetical protein C494_03670 [Natronorubrum bangense JCM 10635]QCC54620.1 hypothetical protein DV706_09155 [Natronorubrum bangense]